MEPKHPTWRATRLRTLALAGALVASGLAMTAAPAGAATTTIAVPGATITRSDATAGTTLTVKATVARLDLWCSAGKLVANKKATTIACSRLLSVTTTGLTGPDTVVINATGFGSALPKSSLTVKTGAGNDTISVRHRTTLSVWAGSGDDRVEAGFSYGTGFAGVNQVLRGEDGADVLTSLGQLFTVTPPDPHVPADVPADTTTLDGGPGVDRFLSEKRADGITILGELDDHIDTDASFVRLATGSRDDLLSVHNDWLSGTELVLIASQPGTSVIRKRVVLTHYIEGLTIDTGAGDDGVVIDGYTPNFSRFDLVGGTGVDSVAFNLHEPCTFDAAARTANCSDRLLRYGTDVERATFSPA